MTHAFGAWPSPIEARHLVAGAASLAEVVVDGDSVCFAEARPEEGGRVAIMRWQAGEIAELSPPDANVRTRVHEYGGGAWWVADGELWYSDDGDQRLRRMDRTGAVVVLTPEARTPRGLRYADGRPTPDGAWYVCVREDHEPELEPRNDLVAVAGDGSGRVEVLASGADFYSSPRISPDGGRLVWLQWNHPNMPWDSTELWLADLIDGRLSDARQVSSRAGVSIAMPGFTSDGELWAVDDSSGWWNLYRFADGSAEQLCGGEFEIATPAWVFGLSRWVEVHGSPIVARTDPTGDSLLDAASGDVRNDWSALSSLAAWRDGVVFVGARHDREPALVHWVPGEEPTVLRPPRDLGLDAGFFPAPVPLVFPTAGEEKAHAWFYEPANPGVVEPDGELPPLLVLAHGGPTGRARTELSLGLRYWTSRGFAVVDVDYRGSTGYGSEYRRALEGRWGIADVEDCVAAVEYLAASGRIDPRRTVIKGGSAGGLTVLGALVETDLFAAGASRYGVVDLRSLAEETHKFEARYCDRLVAPWPEQADEYDRRSPLSKLAQLSAPMIVLQGDADAVVPPAQAEAIVDALRANGLAHVYLVFEGVGHGFRDAETIVTALESELAFFCAILDIEVDGLPDLEIVRP